MNARMSPMILILEDLDRFRWEENVTVIVTCVRFLKVESKGIADKLVSHWQAGIRAVVCRHTWPGDV